MRILDLGSHDGYLTNWLGRQFKEMGVDLTIDGIELNPDAVAVCNARSERDGIPGKFIVGTAEEAEWHFKKGSYDAVLCFELIEHVLNVSRLLSVMEAMLKPNGRVYVSTPDGTFGMGQNPHHLRVYRAVDLADLLRRRGHLTDMEVGGDQVTTISYTPSPRPIKDVAIYTGPGAEPWTPLDIEMKGLGGSETAAVRLADSLSDLGYLVTVYGEVQPAGLVREVIYRHHETFDPTDHRDAVIVSRNPMVFMQPINADRKLLWMHDTDYGPHMTPEAVEQMDAIMVLSKWHRRHVSKMYPFAKDRLVVTRNGIEPAYFTAINGNKPERLLRAIYSSSPDRGLDLLLEWWPEVRKRVPGAELVYCYSSVYDAFAASDPRLREFRDRVLKLTKQPGVINLGSLPQQQLAFEMHRCMAWLAPSYFSPGGVQFNETFCIGAVEAAAAGCSLVASKWGALPERLRGASRGTLVEADPNGKPNREQFIEGIVHALTYDRGMQASRHALGLSWAGVGQDFKEVIDA